MRHVFFFLTCKQSYIRVFGVIGASGHTADSVSDHLQRVSLLDNAATHSRVTKARNKEGSQLRSVSLSEN